MPGMGLNFGGSVIKREAKPARAVRSRLERDGWNFVSEIAGGKISYYERSNINITVMEGPLGTVIIPSGPIRGRVFGDTDLFSQESVLGMHSNAGMTEERAERQMKGSRRTGDRTIL